MQKGANSQKTVDEGEVLMGRIHQFNTPCITPVSIFYLLNDTLNSCIDRIAC